MVAWYQANDAPSQAAIENTVAAATGTMCGTRTLGIDFDESADFGTIAISAMGVDQNDGFVLAEQCAAGVPASNFVNDAKYAVLVCCAPFAFPSRTPACCTMSRYQCAPVCHDGQLPGYQLPQR